MYLGSAYSEKVYMYLILDEIMMDWAATQVLALKYVCVGRSLMTQIVNALPRRCNRINHLA